VILDAPGPIGTNLLVPSEGPQQRELDTLPRTHPPSFSTIASRMRSPEAVSVLVACATPRCRHS
jgi:hypothetical protein